MYNCKIYHDYESPIVLLDVNVETLKDQNLIEKK